MCLMSVQNFYHKLKSTVKFTLFFKILFYSILMHRFKFMQIEHTMPFNHFKIRLSLHTYSILSFYFRPTRSLAPVTFIPAVRPRSLYSSAREFHLMHATFAFDRQQRIGLSDRFSGSQLHYNRSFPSPQTLPLFLPFLVSIFRIECIMDSLIIKINSQSTLEM